MLIFIKNMLQNYEVLFNGPFTSVDVLTEMIIPSLANLLGREIFCAIRIKEYAFGNLIPVTFAMNPV